MEMPFEIFFSCAPEDEDWQKKLEIHLSPLKRQGLIRTWHVYKTLPGSEWATELEKQLASAQIILLLISPDFINSEECWSNQLRQAIERHQAGEVRVIPVLVRPTANLDETPLVPLQMLPRNKKPLSSSRNKDAAFAKVAEDIRTVIKDLQNKPVNNASVSDTRDLWNVPFRQNAFFTGREDVLARLRTTLEKALAAALSQLIAVQGLGGVGKTQTAVEYAYRYRDSYQAILWVKSETAEVLAENFAALARVLDLPEQNEREQVRVIAAVKRWLDSHGLWLLIFDNADDPLIIGEYLPQKSSGHILLTTRASATGAVGIAQKIELMPMSQHEGALLLLRRAGVLSAMGLLEEAEITDRQHAESIVGLLGGLPLALDQAGAYLEETGVHISAYPALYQQERAALLRRGSSSTAHEPVATTWSLAFEQLARSNEAALELMYVCAFLAPDAIPEELFLSKPSVFSANLQAVVKDRYRFNNAIADLRKYALISRNPSIGSFSVHRLVQAVIQDGMDEDRQKGWTRIAILCVNEFFLFGEPGPWLRSQGIFPHALICIEYIKRWGLTFFEAGQLLNTTGFYLYNRGQYNEVEPLYQEALALFKKLLGDEQLAIAANLNNLALLYDAQGKYEQAEPFFQEALFLYKKLLRPEHPLTAQSLNNLANLYCAQGKYEQAEALYREALSLFRKLLGTEHPDTAQSLNNLAVLYHNQGKYEQAELLHQEALSLRKKLLGTEHPAIAQSLDNLAVLYHNQGKYEEAQPLYQQALEIYEASLGPDHPRTRYVRENYARLQRRMQKLPEE